jgi:DNA polymerase III subunit epsilon
MYRELVYAVVDVETTGFSPKHHDRVVEIAVVRTNARGEVLAEYGTLVNPQRDVGPTHVHGISAADVADAPTFDEVVGDVLAVMRGAVLVAHNASFDMRFLCHECAASEAPLPAVDYLCTLSLAKGLAPALPSRRLPLLCEHFGIPLKDAHSALADARATASLLARLFGLFDPSRKMSLADLGARRTTPQAREWPQIVASGRECRRCAAAARNRPF